MVSLGSVPPPSGAGAGRPICITGFGLMRWRAGGMAGEVSDPVASGRGLLPPSPDASPATEEKGCSHNHSL